MGHARSVGISAIAVFLVACDPGLSLRQVGQEDQTPLEVHVKTEHQLIGTTHYVPQIEVTNHVSSPVTVVSVELVTQDGTSYGDSKGTLPATLPPGVATKLAVLFRFNDGVYRVFRKPAKLGIHYKTDAGENVTWIRIEAGRLDDK